MKKYLSIIASVVLAAALVGCSRDEENLFGDSSANRANQAIKDYTEILCAPQNGWLMEYYPEASQSYGGYNILLKFDKNGSVKVASEIAYEDDEAESFYSMKQSAGIVLSFDTYNWIMHAFSDPEAPLYGSTGDGMEGDYDFQVISADKDRVVLKGKKSGGYSVLTPMQDDWEEYILSLFDAEEEMSFSQYACSFGGYDYTFSPSYRNFSVSYTDKDGIAKSFSAPYIQTPTSFKFYQEIDFNGTKISELVFDAAKGEFSGKENSSFVVIPVIPPLNQQLVSGGWFITYANVGSWGKPYFNYADNALLSSEGEHMYVALLCSGTFMNQLVGTSYNDAWGFTFMVDTGYAGQLTMNYELIGENKIAMQFAMAGQGDGVYYHNNCSFNYYLNVLGYNAPRTFTITADNEAAPSILYLTEDANPANTITLLKNIAFYK